MAVEFGTGKTVLILAIVAGCFAVLWPKLFYPMLLASLTQKPAFDDSSQGHFRQERPPHIRPEMIHPALKERGRAIPQTHVVPRVSEKEGKPVPMAGIRPPMGGAGHVVPPPKGTTGTMGIIMPIYTVGIVVFFMYTIMKMMFKKPSAGPDNYPEYNPDPEFRKLVFEDDTPLSRSRPWKCGPEPTKLGWKERDTRDLEIDHLRRRLEETEAAMERIVAQMGSVPHAWHSARGQGEKVQPESTTEQGASKDQAEEVVEAKDKAAQEEEKVEEAAQVEDQTEAGAQTAKETASEAVEYEEEEEEEAEEEEEVEEVDEDEYEEDIIPPRLTNATNCADEAATTTNYTTASAAAEATNATGPEETAADLSALESIGPDDDEDLGDEQDVWNGDVNSDDESEEEVGPHVAASSHSPHRQHER